MPTVKFFIVISLLVTFIYIGQGFSNAKSENFHNLHKNDKLNSLLQK